MTFSFPPQFFLKLFQVQIKGLKTTKNIEAYKLQPLHKAATHRNKPKTNPKLNKKLNPVSDFSFPFLFSNSKLAYQQSNTWVM